MALLVASRHLQLHSRLPLFASHRKLTQWTGKAPQDTPGYVNGALHSLPLPALDTVTRKSLRDYFDNTWTLTEVLFKSLKNEEAFFRPPNHNLRHPKIFYYAHPAAVYINKMRVAGLIPGPLNQYYERIFETGVDEMRWDDMSKNHMKWPTIPECTAYRQQVYNTVVDVIENHPEFDTIRELDKSKFWAVVLGTEHERIHLETSSVLIREMPVEYVQTPQHFAPYHPSAYAAKHVANPKAGVDYPQNPFIGVRGGDVHLGKPRDWPTFGWDNEYGSKAMTVHAFEASKFKVTNGEYLAFVRDQGYLKQKYWTDVGWAWRSFRNTKWPSFWATVGPSGNHQYRLRAMFEVIDMPWNWPVLVNYHEAKAFCAWKNEKEGIDAKAPDAIRIMTEPEHHILREFEPLGADPVMHHQGGKEMLARGYNLNLSYSSESPVCALPPNKMDFHDVLGNAWEWCEDHFSALPNFRVHPYYDDFSLPCFDGLHNLILGGSFISTGDEASKFARFHFRPHFLQFSSFRLVRPDRHTPGLLTSCLDNQGPFVGSNPFRSSVATKGKEAETRLHRIHNEYLHHHYDSTHVPDYLQSLGNYPQRLTKLVFDLADKYGVSTERALDVGCGVGGITFELCRRFKEVIGVDLSEEVVQMAKELAAKGKATYDSRIEGDLTAPRSAAVPSDIDRTRAAFKQSDAYCLPAEMTGYDVVVVSNLLDEIPLPNTALGRMAGPRALVRPGGLLIIASPYSWDDKITPRDLWLGGYVDHEGKPRSSVDGLKALFGDAFALVHETDIPNVVRKHARQYNVDIAHVSVWQASKAQ